MYVCVCVCVSLPYFLCLTFRTQKTNGVVGAVSAGRLLCVGAPEAQGGVSVDPLPRAAGRDPVCGAGLQSPRGHTHSSPVVEPDGVQLLIVTTATWVVHVEPGGPLIII